MDTLDLSIGRPSPHAQSVGAGVGAGVRAGSVASLAQRRLWLIDKLEPGSPRYNNAHGIRLHGPVEPDRLVRAIRAVVDRHQTLRMHFVPGGDGSAAQPNVHLLPTVAAEPSLVDVSHLEQPAAEAMRLAAHFARQPFDLATGPLFRTCLFRLAPEEHLLVLVIHHAISDRWSAGILFNELGEFYGEPGGSSLPPVTFTYADFARWQIEQQSDAGMGSHLAYWCNHLRGAPPFLDLPADHGRPATLSPKGGTYCLTIPADLAARVRQVGLEHGATPFMTYLTAFLVLLHRITHQTDLVIGTPVAGRSRVETERLVGCFINMLPLRAQLQPAQSFSSALSSVRSRVLELLAHQDTPFERIVEAVCHDRDQSRHPLFDVVFNYHNVPAAQPWAGTLRAELEEIPVDVCRFDLTLTMRPVSGGAVRCELVYALDLFDAGTVEQLARRFVMLLEAAVAQPACAVANLPLLAEAERQQLLVEWNDTGRDYPRDQCIHQVFEEQAQRTPEAVAVVFEDRQLTYRQLSARSNQLAHHLRGLGVKPDVLVGLCMERSLEMVIGLLGILKAGGAYVPLDPAYPRQRLAFMLQDTQATVLLTQARLVKELPPHAAQVVCLDEDWPAIARNDEGDVADAAGPGNLAYVIYTSGSTGRPKGVMIPHRGVVRLVCGADYATIGPERVHLQLAPTSFDASTFEIWAPLLHGGRCLLYPGRVALLEDLARVLQEGRVTTLWLTSSLFNTVMDELPEALVGLEELLIGGEALSVAHVEKAMQKLPQTQIINGYGPTESTTFACCYRIPRQGSSGWKSIPIGRPIANTQVYILDEQREPVPVGVPGELYIGGDGLARGYLNRPELTAERFVANPFGAPGSRLYRTGDLVRYRPDGNIEFLGRMDQQVKIRGFRIEPGEIESALARHPAIQQTVVLPREDVPGNKRLVAYIVPVAGTATLPAEDLRAFLKATLPEYMIPSAFVFLQAMPLTPNGKADAAALPAPGHAGPPGAASSPTSLTGEVQTALGRIWREVLRVDRIGPEDSFFELGGHSLHLVVVSARVHRELGAELPLREYFEHPTIRGIASLIERRSRQTPDSPAIRPGNAITEPDALSYSQQRLWLLDRFENARIAYHVSFAQRLTGPVDLPRLERAMTAVCDRHESLRTVFPDAEGLPTQVVLPPQRQAVSFAVVDLENAPPATRAQQIRRLLLEHREAPFDLRRWPLFRVLVVRLADTQHIVAIVLHHIICDDWSIRLLFREAAAYYGGDGAGLSPLPWQYRDYARWQRQWLEGGELQRQLAYWRTQLRGAPSLLRLPTDRPRPRVQTFRGQREPIVIPSHLRAAMGALAQKERTTPFIVFLAAFTVLLARWTRQQDIVVGTPIANRSRPETHGIIGFFLNTLAVRANVGEAPTFRQLLHQVRQTALGAYAHQDVPFERLIEELRVARHQNLVPFVQAMFVMIDQAPPMLVLPGVHSAAEPADGDVAKFDLTLYLSQSESGTTGFFEYNTDLFDAATIRSLRDAWTALLEELTSDPDRQFGPSAQPAQDRGRIAATEPLHAGDPAQSRREPANDMERQLLGIWNEVLGTRDIGVHDSFFDLGGHSLQAVRLVHRVKQRLGRAVPLSALFDAPTVAQFAKGLADPPEASARPVAGERVIVPLRSEGRRRPLFYLPGAGGHAFTFRPVVPLLDPELPVYGVQFHGREMQPEAFASLESLAAVLLGQIRQVQPNGPYRLGGYSAGSVVAFEMARQLRAANQLVEFLALFDGAVPGPMQPGWRRFLQRTGKIYSRSPRVALQYVAGAPRRWARKSVGPVLQDLLRERDAGSSSFAEAVGRVQAAVEEACRRYQPGYYPGTISLFQAQQREQWQEFLMEPSANGWGPFAESVRVYPVPGTHLTMWDTPHITALADALNRCLAELVD